MKYLMTMLFSFLVSLNLYADCEHVYNEFHCVKYIKNYDGDTITVSLPNVHPFFGDEISIRLYGIDAPEIKTKDVCEKRVAIMAKEYVKSRMLRSKPQGIELRHIKRDKYFRILAEVWINGQNLSRAMIKNNLAVEYFGETKPIVDWCHVKAYVPNYLLD